MHGYARIWLRGSELIQQIHVAINAKLMARVDNKNKVCDYVRYYEYNIHRQQNTFLVL